MSSNRLARHVAHPIAPRLHHETSPLGRVTQPRTRRCHDTRGDRGRRLAEDGVHPLQPQLRDRGAGRRTRAAASSSKIKGDRDHPVSRGLLLREGAAPRLLPDRRRSTRHAAAAARRTAASSRSTGTPRSARSPRSSRRSRTRWGGDKILYYGGGGQGNHLGGSYGSATLAAVGNRYRSNALAQEKTGEFWVNGRMIGAGIARRLRPLRGRGLHRQEPVAVARLRARPRDHPRDGEGSRSARSSSSIRGGARRRRRPTSISRSSPGPTRGASPRWSRSSCRRTSCGATGWRSTRTASRRSSRSSARSTSRRTPRRAESTRTSFAASRGGSRAPESVSVYEDLGMQMSVHSTLGSWLQRLVWLLTGHFGAQGHELRPAPARRADGRQQGRAAWHAGRPAEGEPGRRREDHHGPHSVQRHGRGDPRRPSEPLPRDADRERQSAALGRRQPGDARGDAPLDLLVVIDVALTESAREAHYVLPVAEPVREVSRRPTSTSSSRGMRSTCAIRSLPPLPGTLAEPEIHARLVEAMGELDRRRLRAAPRRRRRRAMPPSRWRSLRPMASEPARREVCADRPLSHARSDTARRPRRPRPSTGHSRTSTCRRTPSPPRAPDSTAIPSPPARSCSMRSSRARTGVVFSDEEYDASWSRVRMPERRINLAIPELYGELDYARGRAAPARSRLPVHPVGRRAPLRHDEHDHPQSRVAGEGAPGHAADERSPTPARLGFADGELVRVRDPSRQRRGARRGDRDDAAGPHLAAERRGHGLHAARRRRAAASASRRTSSRPPPTATSSPARRGTSTSRRASSGSPRRRPRGRPGTSEFACQIAT